MRILFLCSTTTWRVHTTAITLVATYLCPWNCLPGFTWVRKWRTWHFIKCSTIWNARSVFQFHNNIKCSAQLWHYLPPWYTTKNVCLLSWFKNCWIGRKIRCCKIWNACSICVFHISIKCPVQPLHFSLPVFFLRLPYRLLDLEPGSEIVESGAKYKSSKFWNARSIRQFHDNVKRLAQPWHLLQ